jgi:hypothetical protein
MEFQEAHLERFEFPIVVRIVLMENGDGSAVTGRIDSTRMLKQGTQTPPPAPDLIPG